MKKIEVEAEIDVLKKFLKKRFGQDIKFEEDFREGFTKGKYKGESFRLTFKKGEYLVFSFNKNEENQKEIEDAFKELKPIFNEVMDGNDPICSYDLEEGYVEGNINILPTLEWCLIDTEDRVKDLVDGHAWDFFLVHNLALLGSRKNEEYLDKAHIFGIYPGSIKNPDAFLTISELKLFLNIRHRDSREYFIHNSLVSQMMPLEDAYAIEFVAYQTVRFGVQIPEPKMGERILATPSYREWFYSHYDNLNEMSKPKRQMLMCKFKLIE